MQQPLGLPPQCKFDGAVLKGPDALDVLASPNFSPKISAKGDEGSVSTESTSMTRRRNLSPLESCISTPGRSITLPSRLSLYGWQCAMKDWQERNGISASNLPRLYILHPLENDPNWIHRNFDAAYLQEKMNKKFPCLVLAWIMLWQIFQVPYVH